MSVKVNSKLERLESAFPKLSEYHQQYVLGVAEGLKFAQSKTGKSAKKRRSLLMVPIDIQERSVP